MRLFAPCDTQYELDCDVKRIGMERIELLEAVNHASHSWKTVVDTRSCDGSRFNSYSEGGVFSLRFRSMYLALALKQLVANVTCDVRMQWSWKRCLVYERLGGKSKGIAQVLWERGLIDCTNLKHYSLSGEKMN